MTNKRDNTVFYFVAAILNFKFAGLEPKNNEVSDGRKISASGASDRACTENNKVIRVLSGFRHFSVPDLAPDDRVLKLKDKYLFNILDKILLKFSLLSNLLVLHYRNRPD